MKITVKRLYALVKNTTRASMSVLTVGLPEFTKGPLKDLQDEIDLAIFDIVESHIAGLIEDEMQIAKDRP